MTEKDWDVVVVGSGAGGAATAYGLCERGLSVLILEAGPRFVPARDYGQAQVDWELRDFPEKVGSKTKVVMRPGQALLRDEPILATVNRGTGRQVIGKTREMGQYHHVRGVGGSTLAFTGEAHRLHPHAMRMRSRFGVAADWPIDYAELERFYVRAEEIVGVAGPAEQGPRWRSKPFPMPPHPLSYGARTLGQGLSALGLQWEANSRAAVSEPHHARPPCNYCGACQMGCMPGDKGSADVTFIDAALKTGRCTVYAGSPVVRIEAGAGDRINSILVGRADGSLERIRTPNLVLAAGAIETPRLLLASGNLGNESGHLGLNFMETVAVAITALHPKPQHARRGLPNDAICWNFNAPDAIPGVVGGCRIYHASAEIGIMGLSTFACNAIAGWGPEHAREMQQTWGHTLAIAAIGENLPNKISRVDLDPVERDRFGMPLARIASYITTSETSRLRFMSSKCREILEASGASEIVECLTTWDIFNSTHVFGTCRMGANPAMSVVNAELRSHRWRNLWITDASVFPSSGGGEGPALTIQALGLRAAATISAE
jgi:choline dehydrogenase-like flavoprotein